MIGKKIKELRIKRGLTQKELAKQAGLSLGAIQGYEQNRYKPKIEQLEKITAALNCDMEYFGIKHFEVEGTIPVLENGILSLGLSGSDSKMGIGDIYNQFDDIRKKEFLKMFSENYNEEIKEVKTVPSTEVPSLSYDFVFDAIKLETSEKIVKNLEKLNKQGQEKLYNYSCDLLEIPKYRADTAPDQEETAPDEPPSSNQKEPDKN